MRNSGFSIMDSCNMYLFKCFEMHEIITHIILIKILVRTSFNPCNIDFDT